MLVSKYGEKRQGGDTVSRHPLVSPFTVEGAIALKVRVEGRANAELERLIAMFERAGRGPGR